MSISIILTLYILVCVLYIFILIHNCQQITVGNNTSKTKWVVSAAVLLTVMVSLQYFNIPQWLISTCFFILLYAIFYLVYRQNMYRSQFIMAAVVLVYMASHIIVQNTASLITQQPIADIIGNDISRLTTSMIALLLCIFAILAFRYTIPMKEIQLINTSKENMYFINQVVICSYLLLLTIFLFLYIQTESNYPQLLSIKSATFSIVFFIIAIRYASNLIQNEIFKEKSSRIEEELLIIETHERRLKNLAYYDTLTKCYNREYALKTLKDLFRTKEHFTLCFIDLDNLKYVNDTFGHQQGDQYILTFAQILKKEIQMGYLCRYGGDEFLAILPLQNKHDAEKIMLKTLSDTREYSLTPNYPYPLSFCYGIAEKNDRMPGHRYKDEMELIHHADKHMYQQKIERKKQTENF